MTASAASAPIAIPWLSVLAIPAPAAEASRAGAANRRPRPPPGAPGSQRGAGGCTGDAVPPFAAASTALLGIRDTSGDHAPRLGAYQSEAAYQRRQLGTAPQRLQTHVHHGADDGRRDHAGDRPQRRSDPARHDGGG